MEKTNTVKKKNGLVLAMCLLFIMLQVISIVCSSLDNVGISLSQIMTGVIMSLVCLFLYFSYRNHTKNVMKPLLGASLMLSLGYEMTVVCYLIDSVINSPAEMAELYGGMTVMIAYCAVNVLLFAAIVLINIIHYMINSTHASSPRLVDLNNMFYIFYIVMLCIRVVVVIACSRLTGLNAVSTIASELSCVFTIGLVIIIERTLDEFRIAREQEER